MYFSCEKEDKFIIEGVIRDAASDRPLEGISLKVDAIRSSSGWGILTDGRRETVASASTDANGYYRIKIKVFKLAESLEFYLNPDISQNHVSTMKDIMLSAINIRETNTMNFKLSPLSILKINFKNTAPVADDDFFSFGWYDNGTGWSKGVIGRLNCGTVQVNEAANWIGKDVCGSYNVNTVAEDYTHVYWTVKKNGLTTTYNDSIFVKVDMINEFTINY